MGNLFSDIPITPISLKNISNGNNYSAEMCQQMIENGYFILSFEEDDVDTIERGEFLVQDKEAKNKHLDPKDENLGYIDIKDTRDFIKLRRTGDRQNQFPTHPENFKEVFDKAISLMERATWTIYTELLHNPKVQPALNVFEDTVVNELQECCNERSSVSCIRYYLPDTPQPKIRDVCDEHTDTGLLTLIMCAKVPGLQVWDRKNKKWFEAEKLLIEKHSQENPRRQLAFCIMGEKISTFTASTALTPTLHRVMVANGVERSSLLYFMDTAK